MLNEKLVTSIMDYANLLQLAQTPCVATWKPLFITTCIDWCLYIETELAVLSNEECAQVCQAAQEKSQQDIPPVNQLLDALHLFFYTLLQNVYLSNSLYLYILKNYRFLTIPEKDILIKDLTQLANEAVLKNIYSDMIQELKQ